MNEDLKKFLASCYTPFHTVKTAAELLHANGFVKVEKHRLPRLEKGGRYYVAEGGTIAAFTVEKPIGFMAALSHTDSPVLKIKGEKTLCGDLCRLNCENYGSGLNYSFFDIPLKICGRAYYADQGKITCRDVVSDCYTVIPSLAIHHNKTVNDGFSPSMQTDLTPLLGADVKSVTAVIEGGGAVIDFDLYACPAVTPFESGVHGEFLSSPRIDNLTSVYASLNALIKAKPRGINLCVCFNSEEIGSRTLDGADSVFLPDLLKEIYIAAGGKNYGECLNNSFMLSLDNAHAAHPAHPEKSDPVNKVVLGGGIVIKRHSHYATTALSAAAARQIFQAADVPVQQYYNHSDMPCGATLGLISACNLGITTCDIGIAQLAMHSAVETCAAKDVSLLQTGMERFFQSSITFKDGTAQIY